MESVIAGYPFFPKVSFVFTRFLINLYQLGLDTNTTMSFFGSSKTASP